MNSLKKIFLPIYAALAINCAVQQRTDPVITKDLTSDIKEQYLTSGKEDLERLFFQPTIPGCEEYFIENESARGTLYLSIGISLGGMVDIYKLPFLASQLCFSEAKFKELITNACIRADTNEDRLISELETTIWLQTVLNAVYQNGLNKKFEEDLEKTQPKEETPSLDSRIDPISF